MNFSTQMYVAPLGCTIDQVMDALEEVARMLYMRGHIGQAVQVHYVGMWDGHYEFLVKGLQDDVMHVAKTWCAMDEQRIG